MCVCVYAREREREGERERERERDRYVPAAECSVGSESPMCVRDDARWQRPWGVQDPFLASGDDRVERARACERPILSTLRLRLTVITVENKRNNIVKRKRSATCRWDRRETKTPTELGR